MSADVHAQRASVHILALCSYRRLDARGICRAGFLLRPLVVAIPNTLRNGGAPITGRCFEFLEGRKFQSRAVLPRCIGDVGALTS